MAAGVGDISGAGMLSCLAVFTKRIDQGRLIRQIIIAEDNYF
jgi:hypothetical protein